ncbi:tyrosine-type recombinase/integrase [Thermanaerothrix sp. 4228-RoL]|uniref:Tyrosine-type recombinase/integrase n=1 Tax=Thermanaerothrix solaris TaxID=3058434 RepID=A0ABU3NKC0_9CHLR|nr:tyrosine-type recombinase/integrase [Thermanaerothrix sp. 4228-RoL]MDT8896658.1 tyrosine-type recombinase/integrase [Thermanaerothrix sp. 4228-RoL]
MKHTKPSTPSYTLSEAIEQFLYAKRVRRLSPNTLKDYERTLRRLSHFLSGDIPVNEITPAHIRRFMASIKLSNKSLLNIYVGLSSFWSWMVREEICDQNLMRKVERPRPEIRAISPFTRAEIDQLFQSIEKSAVYSRPGKKPCAHRLKDYYRSKAILLILLDTGMRASELCGIRFLDFLSRTQVRVFGKGNKERILPLSEVTVRAIEEYVEKERPPVSSQHEYVFVIRSGKRLFAHDLYHRILRIGQRAGIHANPHRFRHTFAINFLRNGGDIYALQAILGHTSLEMVKRYLAIARADVETAHKKASPVICWNLG